MRPRKPSSLSSVFDPQAPGQRHGGRGQRLPKLATTPPQSGSGPAAPGRSTPHQVRACVGWAGLGDTGFQAGWPGARREGAPGVMGGSFLQNQPGNLTPPGSGGTLASLPGGYKPQPSGFRVLDPISATRPGESCPPNSGGSLGRLFLPGIPGPSPRASSDWDSGCVCGEGSGHSPRWRGDEAEEGGLVGMAP